jgi:hypothetical protein
VPRPRLGPGASVRNALGGSIWTAAGRRQPAVGHPGRPGCGPPGALWALHLERWFLCRARRLEHGHAGPSRYRSSHGFGSGGHSANSSRAASCSSFSAWATLWSTGPWSEPANR